MELDITTVNLYEELTATIYTLESQVTARGLYLRSDAPDDLPLVRADSTRLKQVITNLLGNAIKFTKQGGIVVRAFVGEEDGAPVVYTSVIDTGIGIRLADQEVIFDEFRQVDGSVTREYGGTGLGLAITKKLVEMMGAVSGSKVRSRRQHVYLCAAHRDERTLIREAVREFEQQFAIRLRC